MSEWYPKLRADERSMLGQFLDQYRHTVDAKLTALDDAAASAYILPATQLTVGGVVKHLAHMEDLWFQEKLLGVDPPEPWASAPGEEWAFESSTTDSVDELRQLYAEACARSRSAASGIDSLDALAARPSFGKGPVSLRWIHIHMIEETARHAGHIDILCDALRRSTI